MLWRVLIINLLNIQSKQKPLQKHDDILGALRVVTEYNVSTSSVRKTLR